MQASFFHQLYYLPSWNLRFPLPLRPIRARVTVLPSSLTLPILPLSPLVSCSESSRWAPYQSPTSQCPPYSFLPTFISPTPIIMPTCPMFPPGFSCPSDQSIHLAASHYRSDLTGPSHPGACYFSVLSGNNPPAARLLSTYLNTQGTILTTQLTQRQSYLPSVSWWPRIEIMQSGRIRGEMFIKCNWFLLPHWSVYPWFHWNVYPWFFSSVLSGLKAMCFLLHASLCLPWLCLREPETSDALGDGEVTVWPNAHRSQFPKAWHRWWCQVCLASLPPLLLGPLAAPVPSLLHPFLWPCS